MDVQCDLVSRNSLVGELAHKPPRNGGVFPNHESAAKVGLPFLEYRSEIQKYDVIFHNREVGMVFVVRCQGIGSRADEALVPMFCNSELGSASL
jgi:hypothetical protein